MGATSKIVYQGGLRTEAEHLKSGQKIITDAPTDNYGKGEAFSPTDLLATALGACMLTVMGIKAQSLGFDLEDASAEIIKVMDDNPRKVGEVGVKISLKQNCDDKTKKILEGIGLNCPVAKSLASDLKQNVSFEWRS
ncbi:putative redox protein, regulator of disulfide bond formation [Owenweeksia hongkongensis DSM 17368]|uniref:Putative redox protein, regulator of disulfide bond formation n=1 Tax=Owenweeksia hongkongensis (strain DSM 17368 / CIP 108786 / JCM 12287 / NRRL B-23963 / UST20020801) TaxID=926562 RepID=G8R2N7_OWEHD|nr:OsmC family protein [Owenweeksia hongkongensis]AEV31842.1 putative redox protein, regulator of disulfide bond formation [Owenweeksia hongkongensis DSM 17368]